MSALRKNRSGILYILVTIGLFLFIIGFVWFVAWAVIVPIDNAISPVAESFHNESWGLYEEFGYAQTFMTNFWLYLLALAFFGLVFFVYMYSQRRGQPL